MTDTRRDIQRELTRAETAAQINHEQWLAAQVENDALKAEVVELAETLKVVYLELKAAGDRQGWTGLSNGYIAAVQRARHLLHRRALLRTRKGQS